MTTAALIAGYAWMGLASVVVLAGLAFIVVDLIRGVRDDLRADASVTPLYPASSNVRVMPPGSGGAA